MQAQRTGKVAHGRLTGDATSSVVEPRTKPALSARSQTGTMMIARMTATSVGSLESLTSCMRTSVFGRRSVQAMGYLRENAVLKEPTWVNTYVRSSSGLLMTAASLNTALRWTSVRKHRDPIWCKVCARSMASEGLYFPLHKSFLRAECLFLDDALCTSQSHQRCSGLARNWAW